MKTDITIIEALQTAVCYTHFISLLFRDKPYYSIKKYLGNIVLLPFKNLWEKRITI